MTHDGSALLGLAMMGYDFKPLLPSFVSFVQLNADDRPAAPLWSEEEGLIHRRAAESRQMEFRVGRAAAHQALRSLGEDSAPILRGKNGEPIWPEGIVGSITHTAGRALCVVARREQCGGLGVDIEHRDRYFPELAQHVATGEENRWLSALPEARRRRATLELFSAKESIYKAFFPRVERFFDFLAVRVMPVPASGFEARFVETLDEQYPPERRFRVDCAWNGDYVFTSLVLPP